MSTSTTTTTNRSFDTVCEALRDVHDEASLWKLSDELVKVAPSGVNAVEQVVQQAKVRGIPTKSTNTLRLYRDVAIRFPASERVPMVTFSAHREAISLGDASKARQMLEELSSKVGAANVTVMTVKQAISAATGKPVTGSVKAHKAQSSYIDIAKDLAAGGKKFIAAIDDMVASGVSLDSLHTGLSAVLTAVEAKRSKAARKAAAAKPAVKGVVVDPKKSPAARQAIAAARKVQPSSQSVGSKAVKGKAGDLRDL